MRWRVFCRVDDRSITEGRERRLPPEWRKVFLSQDIHERQRNDAFVQMAMKLESQYCKNLHFTEISLPQCGPGRRSVSAPPRAKRNVSTHAKEQHDQERDPCRRHLDGEKIECADPDQGGEDKKEKSRGGHQTPCHWLAVFANGSARKLWRAAVVGPAGPRPGRRPGLHRKFIFNGCAAQ